MKKRQRFRANYDTIGRDDWKLVVGGRIKLTKHIAFHAKTETKIDRYHKCAYVFGMGRIYYTRKATVIEP